MDSSKVARVYETDPDGLLHAIPMHASSKIDLRVRNVHYRASEKYNRLRALIFCTSIT